MGAKFYDKTRLGEKEPKKNIKYLKGCKIIKEDDNIEAILCDSMLMGLRDSITVTDKVIIDFNSKITQSTKRISFSDISSVTIESKLKTRIILGVEEIGQVILEVPSATPRDLEKVYQHIAQKVDDNKKERYHNENNSSIPASEEIQRLFQLKEQGIITEEEFQLKKRQLLGL